MQSYVDSSSSTKRGSIRFSCNLCKAVREESWVESGTKPVALLMCAITSECHVTKQAPLIFSLHHIVHPAQTQSTKSKKRSTPSPFPNRSVRRHPLLLPRLPAEDQRIPLLWQRAAGNHFAAWASKVSGQRAVRGINQDENEKMSTVEGYPLERIFHTAEDSAAQKTADSVILDQEAEDALPKFELSGTLFRGRRLQHPHLSCR
jgi:hypothetical protein